ncbi:MAG TPA: Stp1/IreP family PP2C-type Ser/Thr phosphatase [Kofleriaceae bacterium]|nr:Stp1/IreP family PP2C-type Ser/Thr phosphatase [Kofleriaceae bacterium]
MTAPPLRMAGDTHVGRVRKTNEDSLIVEPRAGLFAVLDGMGGANAGDVASRTARDAIRDFVLLRRASLGPKQLLEQALQAGNSAVHLAAQRSREHHGMGTTVVACLVGESGRTVIAHVGDSRAYLLRDGRLQALTRDHTVVEELVERGLLAAEEAGRHPHKNVLSRNLGSRPQARVDVQEISMQGGDRILLCSDGLYGYASAEGIQYLLGSGDAPEHVCRDLIELALRGGGGDNVSTIVLEAPTRTPAPTSTQVVRTTGATAWWQKRQRFLAVAKERGLTKNPIVRGLDPKEALEVVAQSLCEAVFHDLEKSTGVNVWTFAQNLAGAWFERGGDWAAVRGLIDILSAGARAVIDEVSAADPQLGFLLDVAVSRAFVVAELALGGLLSDRLQKVDTDLIQLIAQNDTLDSAIEEPSDTGERFTERPTIPFLRPERPVTSPGVSSEVLDGIHKTVTIARARTAPRAELVKQVLVALDAIAAENSVSFATAVLSARELYGVRAADDAGIMPLFDALDQARVITTASVHQIHASEASRARVLRAISTAHQRLVGATTGLVLEAVAPYSERLRDVQATTAKLREQLERAERRRAALERKFAANTDPSSPWDDHGDTEP